MPIEYFIWGSNLLFISIMIRQQLIYRQQTAIWVNQQKTFRESKSLVLRGWLTFPVICISLKLGTNHSVCSCSQASAKFNISQKRKAHLLTNPLKWVTHNRMEESLCYIHIAQLHVSICHCVYAVMHAVSMASMDNDGTTKYPWESQVKTLNIFQSICGKGRKIMDIIDIVNQQIAFLFEALTLKV